MKNIIAALLLFTALYSAAQNSCQNAKPFCAGGVSGETFPATTSITAAQVGPNYGCLNTTPNPSWYFLQISNPGTLDILIQGTLTAPPGPGQDVDFICWGPFNSLNGICDSLTANKIVDCSYSGSFTETLNIPNGVTGQYYMVLITNFANVVQDIQFTQFDGTGSTNCGLLGSNSKICAGSVATIVATNSGSLTNPTYSINPPALSITSNSFFVSPVNTTTYTLFITGTNNLSQVITQTAVANVTVFPQPSVSPQVVNSTCTSTVNSFNLNLAFNPTSAAPGYTINWNPTPNGLGSATQQTLSGGINAALYNATVTAAGGCSTTTSFSIDPTPEPAIIDIQPPGLGYTLTCYEPVMNFTSMVATNNYNWSNGLNANITGQYATLTFTNIGTWTVNAVNPNSGCVSTKVFGLGQNTVTPTGTVVPSFQNITCTLTSITTVSSSATPSVNVSHVYYSPLGGTLTALSYTSTYVPAAPGVYTDCAVNDANGCSSCKQFTVTSNQGFPTFTVQSPQSFSLGCTTKSVATINIINGAATNTNQVPTAAPISYTILGPNSSSVLPSGTLSSVSSYTVNTPGTWTVVTKDNTSLCETRLPISVLQNTFTPELSVSYLQQVLTCAAPKVKLLAQSITPNVNYNWAFGNTGQPLNQSSDSISVFINPAAPNSTLVNNYTLTITDNSSTCKSATVVPIFQNIYKPNVAIAVSNQSLSCLVNTVVLTNLSSTGIKGSFPTSSAVVAALWEGPTPQDPLALSSTYVGSTPGVYTMTARDLNNGCINTGTIEVKDFKKYPSIVAGPNLIFSCGVDRDTIFASITNSTSVFTYTWSAPPGVSFVGSPNANPAFPTAPGIFKVLVYNPANGCATSAEINLKKDSLIVDFEADRASGFSPMKVQFSNLSTTKANNLNISSYWNFSNGTFSNTASAGISPNTNYASPGIYSVTLYASKGACFGMKTHTIQVDLPSSISVPNIFTPNGDKVNDVYFLKADNLSELSFTIVDRWGHLVYDLRSGSGNVLWDGKNQAGHECPDGVYFYTLKATGTDGQDYDQKGIITLMR